MSLRPSALVLLFAVGRAEFGPMQTDALRAIAEDIQALATLASRRNRRLQVDIFGQASPDGPDALNERISAQRAERVRDFLLQYHRVPGVILTATGLGTRPAPTPTQAPATLPQPCVFFRTMLVDTPSR